MICRCRKMLGNQTTHLVLISSAFLPQPAHISYQGLMLARRVSVYLPNTLPRRHENPSNRPSGSLNKITRKVGPSGPQVKRLLQQLRSSVHGLWEILTVG